MDLNVYLYQIDKPGIISDKITKVLFMPTYIFLDGGMVFQS